DFARGRDKLDKYRMLVFASSPYVLEGLPDRVLEWIHKGGIAYFSGWWGLATPTGQEQTQLLAKVFQTDAVAFPLKDPKEWAALEASGGWDWRFNLSILTKNPKAEVLMKEKDGSPRLVAIPYGKGRVFIQSMPDIHGEAVREVFKNIVNVF